MDRRRFLTLRDAFSCTVVLLASKAKSRQLDSSLEFVIMERLYIIFANILLRDKTTIIRVDLLLQFSPIQKARGVFKTVKRLRILAHYKVILLTWLFALTRFINEVVLKLFDILIIVVSHRRCLDNGWLGLHALHHDVVHWVVYLGLGVGLVNYQSIWLPTFLCRLLSGRNEYLRVLDALSEGIYWLNEFEFLMKVYFLRVLLFFVGLCFGFGEQTWCSVTWVVWYLIYYVFGPWLRLTLLLTVFLSNLIGNFVWIGWEFLRILYLFFSYGVVIKIFNFLIGDWNMLIFLVGFQGLLFIRIFGLGFRWPAISSKFGSGCKSNLIYLGECHRFHLQLLQIAICSSRSLLTVSEVILSKHIALATAKEKSGFSIWIDCI